MSESEALKVYTPAEAAETLKVNPQTLWRWIREGRIRASKLGRVYRIRQSDLEQFLDDTATS